MKVLFDLNVVLDVFMNRSPWVADSQAAVQLVLDQKAVGYVSAISVTTLFYICRRAIGTEKARLVVERCLAVFEVATVDQAVLLAALAAPGGDFEDNVQLASAQASGVDALVTRDASGFNRTQTPVLSPKELVEQFARGA